MSSIKSRHAMHIKVGSSSTLLRFSKHSLHSFLRSFGLDSSLSHFHSYHCYRLAYPIYFDFSMKLSIAAVLMTLGFSIASPIANLEARTVTALRPDATAEAHPKDNTATRAVTNSPIKVSPFES